jgi:hypothetical protein
MGSGQGGGFPGIPHFAGTRVGGCGEGDFRFEISDFRRVNMACSGRKNITPLYTGPKVHVLYLFVEKSGGNYFWGVRLKRI